VDNRPAANLPASHIQAVKMQPQDMNAIPTAKIVQSTASIAMSSFHSGFMAAPALFNRVRGKNLPDRMSQGIYVAG
jgi:hypothetical protein